MTENERVKQIRKLNNLTLEAFGSKIGVSASAISQIERGKIDMSSQTRLSICREFNINETWLRTGEGEMRAFQAPPGDDIDGVLDRYKLPRELRGLFIGYLNLPEQSREEVRQMIRGWAVNLAEQIAAEQTNAEENKLAQEEKELEGYHKRLDAEFALEKNIRDAKAFLQSESGKETGTG